MKIQAQSSLLLRQALQKAAKCIDSKSTIAILSNALLTQRKEDGQFFFVSATTDSELSIPAPLSIVEGSFKEDVVLPITSLLSLLSTLPADCVVTMDLSQDKNRSMNIEYCTQNGEKVKKVTSVWFISAQRNSLVQRSLIMPAFISPCRWQPSAMFCLMPATLWATQSFDQL